jgi:hypothetical protein
VQVPFDIDGGAVKSRTYKLTFDGKLYSRSSLCWYCVCARVCDATCGVCSGALAFGFMAPLTLCTVRCKINGIEALANFPAVVRNFCHFVFGVTILGFFLSRRLVLVLQAK